MLDDGTSFIRHHLFVYCANAPVNHVDPEGNTERTALSDDGDGNPFDNGIESPGGGSFWSSFKRTIQGAADGLNMAMGQRKSIGTEDHHILSNKNQKYSPQFEKIVDRYGMSLSDSENIVELSGHKGRHTNTYHEFMLEAITLLDSIAEGDIDLFYEGFGILRDFLIDNKWLPYAK